MRGTIDSVTFPGFPFARVPPSAIVDVRVTTTPLGAGWNCLRFEYPRPFPLPTAADMTVELSFPADTQSIITVPNGLRQPMVPGTYTMLVNAYHAGDCSEEEFALHVVPSEVLAQPTPGVTGRWSVTITVTNAEGKCAEDVGATSTQIVSIMRDGVAMGVTGLGDSLDPWFGTLSGRSLQFGGQRPKAPGVTTSELTLTLSKDGQTFRGIEALTWQGLFNTCSNGVSDVTDERFR